MVALVQHASNTAASGTSVTVTLGAGTTAGNFLVACVTTPVNDATVTSITLGGSAGNWAQAIDQTNATFPTMYIWTDPNCAGGQTSVVVHLSTSDAPAVDVYEVSGMGTSPTLDKSSVNGSAGTGAAWTSNATATTTTAAEFVVGMYGGFDNIGGTPTFTGPSSPWTNETVLRPGTGLFQMSGYQVTSGTAAYTYSGSSSMVSPDNVYSAIVVAFAPSASGPAPLFPLHQPVSVAGNRLVPPQRGRAQGISHSGVYNQIGPAVTPARGPVRARIPQIFSKGRAQGQAGWRSFTLFNTFESQASGTSITTGNSGGVDGSSAFDATNVVAGGTLAYDNTEIAHGNISGKFATASTAGTAYVGWAAKLGVQQNILWFRTYCYFTANPLANGQRIVAALQGSSAVAGITVDTAGLLHSVDSTGANRTSSTHAIPLNKWFRVEGFITGSPNEGQVEFKLFEGMDSVLPLETQTSASTLNTFGPISTLRFGHGAGSSLANLGPWWQDDIGVSNTGYMGPTLFSGPPVYPLQGPIRSRLPGPFRKGRSQGNPGIYDGVGPHVRALPGPIRSRLPGPFRKGSTQSTPPYVPPYVIIPVAPPPPWHHPVGISRQAPGPFRKGHVQSNAGVREQTGPPLTPLKAPVRARILQTFSKGRTEHNAGKYNQTGPKLTPLQRPVSARRPGPYLHGRVQSETGVFNQVGPKLKAWAAPVRAVFPGPFRKGRSSANKGAPVNNPPPAPTQLNFIRPARPIRFAARLLPSRRRRFDPRWPQGPLTEPYPVFTTQSGKHPRVLLRLLRSNRRRAREQWGQANQGTAWPTGPRRTAPKPRLGARLRRGRFFIPTPAQGNRGIPYFTLNKARPRRLIRTATRSRVFRGWPQASQGQAWPTAPRMAGKRPRVMLRMLPSRRRRFDFPMGQGNRGSAYPAFRQPSHDHRRYAARLMQSRRREWFTVPPQGVQGQAFPSYIRGKGPRVKLLARLRQSRQRRWDHAYRHVTNSVAFAWNVEQHLAASRVIEWDVRSHVISVLAVEWNVGITVQSRPRMMTSEGWGQGMNAARLMTEEGKGYMGGSG